MKPSNYNLYIDQDDRTAIYNTLQGSLARVDTETLRILQLSPSNLKPEQVSTFRKLGFLVDEKTNELNLFRMKHESVLFRADTFTIALMITKRCNCKCLYCYEEGYREPDELDSADTEFDMANADTLIEFILSMASSFQQKKVDFSFHGGEPSLRIDLIQSLASKIREALQKAGLEVSFSMVTNGFLIDMKVLDSLMESGIERLLFTIDGTAEIHDERRPLTTGSGTYKKIYENMKNAVEQGMKVYLGINIDKHNAGIIDPLLEQLAADFRDKGNMQVIFAFVTPGKESTSFCDQYCFKQFDEKSDAMMSLYEKADSLGLNIAEPLGSPYCSARALTDVILSPDGNVYKCTSLAGHDEAYMGSIFEGAEDVIKASSEFVYGWNAYEYTAECKKCKFLPMCLGGCIEESILHGRKRTCQRKFFERVTRRSILLRLKQIDARRSMKKRASNIG